jgi:RNA polymerase sigma-70 factor (ECF subfamily)
LALAKAGNAAAIDELVASHWQEAYRTAARILRCHADAEEAAQDALCSAVAHLSTFREDASFGTWVHRITVNKSLMLLRQKNRRADSRSRISTSVIGLFTGSTRTPEQLAIEAECQLALEKGFATLPDRYVHILRLSVFEGRSPGEIAERVGLSPCTVKTRLHRGRLRLQREISRRLQLSPAEREPRQNPPASVARLAA